MGILENKEAQASTKIEELDGAVGRYSGVLCMILNMTKNNVWENKKMFDNLRSLDRKLVGSSCVPSSRIENIIKVAKTTRLTTTTIKKISDTVRK